MPAKHVELRSPRGPILKIEVLELNRAGKAFADAFEERFAQVADPIERAKRAEAVRRAYFIGLGEKSGAARRAKRGSS